VTFGIPGRAASASALPRRTAPAARISLAALRLNLRAVMTSTPHAIIDVRADAWGHGAEIVTRAAVGAGARALLVDSVGAAALRGSVDASLLMTSGVPASPEAVYGLSDGFTPVLRLSGFVLSLKPLRAGEGVSYGYTHRAARDTIVALVTGGYAQGVVRALGNAATVQIAGVLHPIVGRVAMDVCVVDVGDAAVAPGDEVVFFGDPARGEPSLSAWSRASGMNAAELVTAVGLRNAREYVA
jgi:alanine racemase